MSEAAPRDIVIVSHPTETDGYVGIVVDRGRVVSNSNKGVQDDISLAELQRRGIEMTAFRYVGLWNYYHSKPFDNAGFNQAEVRIPAGQPGGGQWTAEGTMAARHRIAFGGTPKSQNCSSDHTKTSIPRMRGRLGPDGSITLEPLPDKSGDDNSESKMPGQVLKEIGGSMMSTLIGITRSIFHPDPESSKPKTFSQLQDEIERALDDIDITAPRSLGRATALAIVIVASEALSGGDTGTGDISLPSAIKRGPQGVIDQLSSNLEPESLTIVQAREWYNATKVIRSDIIAKMRAAGYSIEKIARQAFELRNAARTEARELMINQEAAAKMADENPNMTWEEVVKKYNGDYELIIKKSLESNKEIDQFVEQLRQKQ